MVNRLWTWLGRLPAPIRRFFKALPGSAFLRDLTLGRPRGGIPGHGPAPIVYLPTWLEWDVMKQRPQFLLEAMAEAGHQVYFVDPRLKRAERRGGVTLVPGLAEVPQSGVVLYGHFAPVFGLVRRFDEPLVWYDYLDDVSIYASADARLPRYRQTAEHHDQIIKTADLVTCSNPVLLERADRADALLVENGVAVESFLPDGARAVDLPSGRPIVGFHGAVGSWFDLALLEQVASRRPQYDFVIVGPLIPGVQRSTDGPPNVHWMGGRPSDRIGDYVRGFDVGIIPFVVDDMTRGVTPLKMYEYLAAGKPVVSTPLPAAIEHPEVLVGSGAEDFADLVDRALLDEGATDRRIAAAEAAAWDRRILPLLERLESLGRR